MSTHYNVHCVECDEMLFDGYELRNSPEVALSLVADRESLSMAYFLSERLNFLVELTVRVPGCSAINLGFFYAHALHRLRVISEYGDEVPSKVRKRYRTPTLTFLRHAP